MVCTILVNRDLAAADPPPHTLSEDVHEDRL